MCQALCWALGIQQGQDTATADFPEPDLERGPETPSKLIMQMIIQVVTV